MFPKRKETVRIAAVLLAALASCARYDVDAGYLGLLSLLSTASRLTPVSVDSPVDGTVTVAGAAVSPAPLKSVQRGLVNLAANPQLVTITAVDPSRAFVLCSYRAGSSSTNRAPICRISSATQVVVQAGTADPGLNVAYQVVEFASGARVQSGTGTLNAGSLAAAIGISAVDLTKSFIILHSMTTDTGTLIDEHRTMRGGFASSTLISLLRNQATITTEYAWQVVELQSASVQRGANTLPNGAMSINIALSAVDPTKTFVITSVAADNMSDGVDSQFWIRCRLSSTIQLQCARQSAVNAPVVAWFVVSLSDDAVVQAAQTSTAANTPPANNSDTSISRTLGTAVQVNASLVLHGSTVGGTTDFEQDSATWTANLTSATNVDFERGSADNFLSELDYQVVQFDLQ